MSLAFSDYGIYYKIPNIHNIEINIRPYGKHTLKQLYYNYKRMIIYNIF